MGQNSRGVPSPKFHVNVSIPLVNEDSKIIVEPIEIDPN